MNNNRFRKGLKIASLTLAFTLSLSSCSDTLADMNKNSSESKDISLDALFRQMQEYTNPVQENAYQMNNNLLGDIYGRYMNITNSGFSKNGFGTFNAPAGWIDSPFNDVFTKSYGAWMPIKEHYEGTGVHFAWAQILRVAAFQRITDMYGPIPYSKAGTGAVSIPYDSQEEVYNYMFETLNEAIDEMTGFVIRNPEARPKASCDELYGGDYGKWVKFANSLKLRMAMRIVYADPVLAKQMAEEVINHPIGLITENKDNALIAYHKNPINVMWDAYSDTRVGADIVAYMQGYQDPRMEKYFQPSQIINGSSGFYGIRIGINIENVLQMLSYSAPIAGPTDKLLWMNASEVAFLRAEGATKGWNMGGTEEDFYNQGIRLSFDERGAAGADTYLANDTRTPGNYVDPYGIHSMPATSDITIKWDGAANAEKKLERIITQKWIAMWPLGQEAWSEQRRTGYPKFMPAVNNYSGEAGLNTKLAARIPFPPVEAEKNATNYNDAVQKLGGPDKYGTKLWWDKKVK